MNPTYSRINEERALFDTYRKMMELIQFNRSFEDRKADVRLLLDLNQCFCEDSLLFDKMSHCFRHEKSISAGTRKILCMKIGDLQATLDVLHRMVDNEQPLDDEVLHDYLVNYESVVRAYRTYYVIPRRFRLLLFLLVLIIVVISEVTGLDIFSWMYSL